MSFLSDMALFVALVESKTFTRTAEHLEISVSSLSRRINALEKTIGLKLLNRTTRTMVLTEAGQLYYDRCAHLVSEAQIAHEDLQTLLQKTQGHLRISMTPDFGVHYVSPHLPEFMRQYPDITLELDMSSRRVEVLSEHFDVVMRMGSLESSGLIAQNIGNLKRGLFASPKYFDQQKQGKPLQPEDLIHYECIRMGTTEAYRTWTLQQKNETKKIEIKGPLVSNSMRMNAQMAQAGHGIALLDVILIKNELLEGRLIKVLPDWSTPDIKVFAVTIARQLPAKTQAWITFFSNKFRAAI